MNSKELRKKKPENGEMQTLKRNPIYLVLDTIIDTYNIGSLFRLADAIAAEKVYICGDTEYPPSSKIHKAAVGTEEWVPWEKKDTALEAINELKKNGVQIISVEQSENSIPFNMLSVKTQFPCAIVVGNETTGVSEDALKASDFIVELPMFGFNKSFNVWGSAAVISYNLVELLIAKPFLVKKTKK